VIHGIGIDVVEVARMQVWLDRPEILSRYFFPAELADIRSRGDSAVLSLAARFAAKEAYGKALGTGMRGIRLKDIQVRNDEHGKPEMFLHGTAAEALLRSGAWRVHLSMSHERKHALAMVVIETRE